MPSILNVLICVLACVIGVLIGKIYRTHHKTQKDSRYRYTKDGKIDMTQYKNLTALHEKMEKRSREKESRKDRKH